MKARRLGLCTIVVSLILCTPGVAGPPQTSALEARVDELFEAQRRSDAPGGVVAVIRDGRIVHETAFGMADLERAVAVTPESVFEIGSISKQFTAMCILLLEHDGKLSLDDDVRDYVPELPEYGRPITLRHLLHHTSGIRDIETLIPLAGMPWVNYYRPEELLELVTRQRGLNFPPGDRYLYSNSGYQLLAEVVERVSGQPLRDFARQRIFGPLGMSHTQFWDHPSQIVKSRAIAYSEDADGDWGNELWNLPFAGPAGVYTSIDDLARWDANFYDNRLGGGSELIARMETPGVLESGEEIDYAAGLRVSSYRGQRLVSHGGAWMGYRASFLRFPGLRLSVVALSNSSRGLGAARVADLYLDELLEPSGVEGAGASSPDEPTETTETTALTVEELAPREGAYWNESQGLLRRIELRDGTLHYVRGPDNATPLAAIDERRFVMLGTTARVEVAFEGRDQSAGMMVQVDDEEPLRFGRVEPPSGEALAGIAGDYWSVELERTLRLEVEGDRLRAAWVGDDAAETAEPIATDEFLLPQFVPVPWYPQDVRLALQREDSGAVRGLTLSCDMVRGIAFQKRPRP